MFEYRSRHQDIAELQDENARDSFLEDAVELTDVEFTPSEKTDLPELTRLVEDVHEDLVGLNCKKALNKLQEYFTRDAMAYATTEEFIEAHLDTNFVPGAFKIDKLKIVEMQVGMYALYERLQELSLKKQIVDKVDLKQAPSVMYKK